MEGPYVETGGLRYGSTFWSSANCTWPFARLEATSSRVTLTTPTLPLLGDTIVLPHESIDSIVKVRGLLSVGARFVHHEEGPPPYIAFWTFSFERLKSQLQDLGYVVLDTPAG
jgi:hypothetical protein